LYQLLTDFEMYLGWYFEQAA